MGLFLFLILVLALSNYAFAKIPATRCLIDHYLGDKFVSLHEINMLPRQAAKVVAAVGVGLAVKHGDDYVTAKMNAEAYTIVNEAVKKSGAPMPDGLAREILSRPSTAQQIVSAGLDSAREIGKGFGESVAKGSKGK